MNASIHVGGIHWELGEHIENLLQVHWAQYNLTFFVDVGMQIAKVMENFLHIWSKKESLKENHK
jgi:hypothetical protein